MQITVKTTGLLGKYLPDGSSRNKGVVELPDSSTARDLLVKLKVPDDGRCTVILNDTLLQADEIDKTLLNEQDAITLMAPITAG